MRILITECITWTDEQKKLIEQDKNELLYVQDERIPLSEQGIDVTQIEGAICNGLFLYNDIEEFTNLKYIQLTSAGYDRVPLEYIKEKGIRIYNARGVYSIPMAEFVLGGILQLYKNSKFFGKNQENHEWKKCREIRELYGRNICILGCGSVGTECAKRFSAFGCHVFGVDICAVSREYFDEIVSLEMMDDVLAKSDIVVSALPLTDDTRNMINKNKFDRMKNDSIFVNISRGDIVNTGDLITALKNNISGAVLDVFEEEPLGEEHPLWKMDNVIITPHNSFVGEGNRDRLQDVIMKNLKL